MIFLVIQGVRYLRPYMLWTNPKVSDTQSGSGGFLDPMLGTIIVSDHGDRASPARSASGSRCG